MEDRLVEVMLIGTSGDAEWLDRLARDLDRPNLRAVASPLTVGRPVEDETASAAAAVVLLWTRSAAGSEWLVDSVEQARTLAPVVVGLLDDLELPSYLRGAPVADIMAWRSHRSSWSVQPLADLLLNLDRNPPSPQEPEYPSEVTPRQQPPAADGAPAADDPPAPEPVTGRPGRTEVDVTGLRPAAKELVVLADAIAGRRGAAPDVVLAAVLHPTVTRLDPDGLTSGAADAMHGTVPDPKREHIAAALTAVGAASDPSMRGLPDLDPSATSALSLSAELAALVEQASRLAADLGPSAMTKSSSPPPPEVDAHHLIGVALARSSLPPAVVRALGVDDDTLRAAFLASVKDRWPGEDPGRWNALLARPPAEAVATFHHDDTRRRDLLAEDSLDIEPHVRALALLVTSKVLEPPLAVGLFGDWGSGKTFFMRALRQEVDRLTRGARASGLPQRELPVFRNVAQIEFNAWHFVDADLWASLADYIFANLRIKADERPDEVSQRRELYVAKLSEQGAAIRQVETQRQHLQARIELSESELEQVRAQARLQLGIEQHARAVADVSPGLVEDIGRLALRLGLPQVGSSIADLEDALTTARDTATSSRSTIGVLTGRFGAGWSLAAVATLLLGPLVLWLTSYLDLDAVQRTAATVAGVIGGAAAAIRTATEAVRPTLRRIDELGRTLEREVEDDTDVRRHREALADLEKTEEVLADREVQLRGELVEVEKALRELSPAKLLADFILSRNDSDDYRKHLGLASLIRRDFEALAEHIDGFNASLETEEAGPDTRADTPGADEADQSTPGDGRTAAGPPSEAEYHVNRIVLYIDDLDRCPPETVAKVLQAVHLLLAFPLFVVVVGVDARWLSRSLTQHYQGLLDSGGRDEDGSSASPQDYLEKIFQIPFWLKPMPLDATARLLDALTEARPAPDSRTTGAGSEAGGGTAKGGEGADGAGPSPDAGDRAPLATDDDEQGVPRPREAGLRPRPGGEVAAPYESPAYDLRISSTEVTGPERAFMQELRPLLGRSPRTLTRYVNIFRLLKAVNQHDRAVENSARPDAGCDPDEVTMFLLAVLTGHPDVAQPLLDELAQHPPDDESEDGLVAVVRRARRRSRRPSGGSGSGSGFHRAGPDEGQWDLLEQWLAEHEDWTRAQRVGTWAPKARTVARYSYRYDAFAPARAGTRAGAPAG